MTLKHLANSVSGWIPKHFKQAVESFYEW